METPVRRVTRSQTSGRGPSSGVKPAAGRPSSGKKEFSRAPFTDLTNDSPIAGLFPAKMAANSGCVYESTPRSKLRPSERAIGEDLLRMQVTTLLRKVESEAAAARNPAEERVPDVFDSPTRLAAPTPANTPAAASGLSGARDDASQGPKPQSLPRIVISAPVCNLDIPLKTEKSFPGSTQSAIEGAINKLEEFAAQQEQLTTRTLQFDSPDKPQLTVEATSSVSVTPTSTSSSLIVERSTPASVTTTEVLASIDEDAKRVEVVITDTQFSSRPLDFPSPVKELVQLSAEKRAGASILPFDVDMEHGLFFWNGKTVVEQSETDDEDSWSVIVNVHSPEKSDRFTDNDFANISEDAATNEFVESLLVDPAEHRIEIPALWNPASPVGEPRIRKDDEEDEDDEVHFEEGDEEEDADENYEDESGEFDESCEELCRGISGISMGGDAISSSTLPAFEGKHVRFNYDSDDEMVEDVVFDKTLDSPSKVRLSGYPTPKGKHLRFNDDDDEKLDQESSV